MAGWSLSAGNLLSLLVTQGKGYSLRFLDGSLGVWEVGGLGQGTLPNCTPGLPLSLLLAGACIRLTQKRGKLVASCRLLNDSLWLFTLSGQSLFFFSFFPPLCFYPLCSLPGFRDLPAASQKSWLPWQPCSHQDLRTWGASSVFLLFSLPPLGPGDTVWFAESRGDTGDFIF